MSCTIGSTNCSNKGQQRSLSRRDRPIFRHHLINSPHTSHRLCRSLSNAHSSASVLPALADQVKHHASSWIQSLDTDNLTKHILVWCVVPAALLAVQPLLGKCSASLAWQASLRDMFSFTVLLGVFITCEPAAAVASGVSAAGAALPLLVHSLGQLPAHAAITALLLMAAIAATLWAARLPHQLWRQLAPTAPGSQQQRQQQQQQAEHIHSGSSSNIHMATSHPAQHATGTPQQQSNDSQGAQWGHLEAIQQWLGVLGGGLLLQFLWETATSQLVVAQWGVAVAVGAAGVMATYRWLDTSGKSNSQVQELRRDWPAWSATLLLVLQPLEQLVQLALHPGPVQPSSPAELAALVLLVLASGLMVPRALHTRQFMWFTGTCNGALLAAGQLFLLGLHAVSQSLQLTTLPSTHGLSGAVAPSQQCAGQLLGPLAGFSSLMWVGGSWFGGASGLAVGGLLVWLWLTGSLLHKGWRFIGSTGQG